ncbi:MAG: HIT domain-containing protein [Thaumarchaeota archaeon]|nr:HIT domain-containing protein [Nitrososphaerota archaeon]
MDDCIFCSIIEGKFQAAMIHRDDSFVALMDKYPINRGHALVMPVKHYPTILDMPHEQVGRLFILVTKVARGVKDITGAAGLNIGLNNGRAAAQLIPHLHVHVIPRHQDDGASWSRPSRLLVAAEDLSKLAEAIRQKMRE